MSLTPIYVYRCTDINDFNVQLWGDISKHGRKFTFGSQTEPKEARELFSVVQVYGEALNQLYNGELPHGWKFGQKSNQIYIEMLKDPDPGDQPYTYGQRMHRYPQDSEYEFNQIGAAQYLLKQSIEKGIQTNRICGIIWHPLDLLLKDPPCFQWFQLRVSDGNKVSLRTLFRSQDAGNAIIPNLGAITRLFCDEVIWPAGGELEEIIHIATSEHIYETDMDMVDSLIGSIPEHIRRLLTQGSRVHT